MAIEQDFFRQVMGRFPTGVTIVTTEHDGVPGGLTVNSFCSVSLNPSLVLVCIDLSSRTLPLIRASKKFAVNMLSEDQEELSRSFAITPRADFNRFSYTDSYKVATGAPILYDVLAFVDARVVAEYPGGDHTIFLAQVQAMGTRDRIVFADDESAQEYTSRSHNYGAAQTQKPLAFFEGKYRQIANVA